MLAATAVLALSSLAGRALAQQPLIEQRWPWPYNGPERIDTSNGPRGLMQGVNRCNATTEGPTSECVNTIVNSIQDFCIYGLPEPDVVGNREGEAVAFCQKTGYGTRIIPDGSITGLQEIRAPGYIAIAGYIDQTKFNINAGDQGGELDPHGADLRGNPIGSLMYSTAFGAGGNGSYQQVIQWHLFIGGGTFCLKACNPAVPPNSNGISGNLCENRFDTQGCLANVPLNYAAINGTFTSCQGDNQQVPNGNQLPIPASSSCTTYASTQLFSATSAPSASASASASSSASSGASAPTTAPSSASLSPNNNAVSSSQPPRSDSSHSYQSLGLVAVLSLAGLAGLAVLA